MQISQYNHAQNIVYFCGGPWAPALKNPGARTETHQPEHEYLCTMYVYLQHMFRVIDTKTVAAIILRD